MKKCVIIGGADILNYNAIRKHILPGDYMIFCDSGLRHRSALGGRADLVIGDFDSHNPPDFPVETITLPRRKDDTDAGYAVKEALRRGFDTFTLTGVIGNRLDHSLGNISLLLALSEKEKTAFALDDYSRISVIRGEGIRAGGGFSYFSLINLFGGASDISIENARFPLSHAEIPMNDTLGISNEALTEDGAVITIGSGCLLLIEDY